MNADGKRITSSLVLGQIVQNSVERYGMCLALDAYRIALSATVREGDWREQVTDCAQRQADGSSGSSCSSAVGYATSLLVVQDLGPDWLREREGQ